MIFFPLGFSNLEHRTINLLETKKGSTEVATYVFVKEKKNLFMEKVSTDATGSPRKEDGHAKAFWGLILNFN